MGFRLQQKDQNHTAISNCCLTGAKEDIIPQFWTGIIQMLSKNSYDCIKPTKLKIASILPKFLR